MSCFPIFNSSALGNSNAFKAPFSLTIVSNSSLFDLIFKKVDCYICNNKESLFVQFLINNDAISNFRFEREDGSTLKTNLYGLGHQMDNIHLSPYDRAFLAAKLLGQVFPVNPEVTIDGTKFHLSGMHTACMFTLLSEKCEEFFKQNGSIFDPQEQQQMISALCAAGKPQALISANELVLSIQSGKMTFVRAGWHDHSICLGFCNGQMVIGNTGECPAYDPNLIVFDIDPNLVTEELITYIGELSSANVQFAYSFLYKELPKILCPNPPLQREELEDDDVEGIVQDAMRDLISSLLPDATVGNCSFESAKAALFTMAIALKQPSVEAKRQMHLELANSEDAFCDIQVNVTKIFDTIKQEIQAIYIYVALDHLTTYCDHYYSPETGLPAHFAVPKNVIQICWSALRYGLLLSLDYKNNPGICKRLILFFDTHPHLGLESESVIRKKIQQSAVLEK
jgi:hypothetical protein